jgi:hypothetical protein
MSLTPRKERKIQMPHCKEERRRSDNEGEKVGGVNSGEASPPKLARIEVRSSIRVNKDEARQDKEEVHPDIADSGKVLIPPGASSQNAFDFEVKQDDVEGGKET